MPKSRHGAARQRAQRRQHRGTHFNLRRQPSQDCAGYVVVCIKRSSRHAQEPDLQAEREPGFLIAVDTNRSHVGGAQCEELSNLELCDFLRQDFLAKVLRMNAADGTLHGNSFSFVRYILAMYCAAGSRRRITGGA
jgi:hypothetical protein